MSHTWWVCFSPFSVEGAQRTTVDIGVQVEKMMATIQGYLGDYLTLDICVYCICSVITLEESGSHCAHASLSAAGRTIRFSFFLLQILFVTMEQIINIISLST